MGKFPFQKLCELRANRQAVSFGSSEKDIGGNESIERSEKKKIRAESQTAVGVDWVFSPGTR